MFPRTREIVTFKNRDKYEQTKICDTYIALQDMQTFKNQAKIMLPFLVMLLLIKVSNCA